MVNIGASDVETSVKYLARRDFFCSELLLYTMIRDIRYLENTHTLPHATVVDHDEKMERLKTLATPTDDRSRICGTIGVVGPPGSGKTTVVDHVLREFTPDGSKVARINCWQRNSREDVLDGVADGLLDTPAQRDPPPCATAVDELSEPADAPRYVVLDEANQLPDTSVLYDLSEIPNIQTYLIATELRSVERRLDQRTLSRIRSGEYLEFEPYATEELARILCQRVAHGLADNAISEGELVRIAAESKGDARLAIETLRDAAFAASDAGADRIHPGHVAEALPVKTPRERAGERVGSGSDYDQDTVNDAPPVGDLSPDCAVLARLVADSGMISPGELYERYTETVDDPKSDRHVRDLVRQLQEHNVLERHGNGPSTRLVVAESGPRTYLEV